MISIREERPEDIDAIHHVESQAFGQTNQADLVDALRRANKVVLSLVAIEDERVLGHIMFSPAALEHEGEVFDVMALGPVAVLPERQNEGIGSMLVRNGLKRCLERGHDVVFLIGHPNYYPRFGFVPAATKGIRCGAERLREAFMVAELRPGALAGRQGRMRFQPEFEEYG